MNELAILLLQAAVAAMKSTPGAASLPVSQQAAPAAPQAAQAAPVQPQAAPVQPQAAPVQPQVQNYIPPAQMTPLSLQEPQATPGADAGQVPPVLQQLIQQMNREGAQFDMPPAGPTVYDKLSDHLASLYTNSKQQ